MSVYLRAQWEALYQSTAGYVTVWLLLYSLTLALASSIFFYEIPLPDETTTLSDVSYKISDVTDPLQLSTDNWHATTLPDNWETRPDKVKNIWYRGNINLDHTPKNQWGVLIPALKMNAAVYMNGVFLGDGGRFTDPVARNWMPPLLFSVPNSLLHTGTNTLYIRVKSDPAGSGKLDAM